MLLNFKGEHGFIFMAFLFMLGMGPSLSCLFFNVEDF